MHPLVRDLYKRVLAVGRDYPGGLDVVHPPPSTLHTGRRPCLRGCLPG